MEMNMDKFIFLACILTLDVCLASTLCPPEHQVGKKIVHDLSKLTYKGLQYHVEKTSFVFQPYHLSKTAFIESEKTQDAGVRTVICAYSAFGQNEMKWGDVLLMAKYKHNRNAKDSL